MKNKNRLLVLNFYLVFNLTMVNCTTQSFPIIIGHRGAKGYIAENTLPSIKKAIDLGANGVEIDIFRCASGELVVFHDKTLEKLTNATGYIEELDIDSIQKIEVLEGYTIPTLNEVLDLIKGRIFVNIELKGSQTAIKTNEILNNYLKNNLWSSDKFLISSFDWDELKIFRKVNQKVPVAVITEDDPLDAIPVALELNAVAINPDYKTLNSFNIKKIKEKKLKIYPWTVNEIGDINMMIDFQVDGIITDFPDRIPKPIN